MATDFFKRNVDKKTLLLSAIIIVESLALVFTLLFNPFTLLFGQERVKPFPDFQFQDLLTCFVVQSSLPKEFRNTKSWLDVRKIQLRGLTTDNPEIFWKNPNPKEELKNPYITSPTPDHWVPIGKLYDHESYITLGSVSFASDVLGIDKKTGSFVRTLTEMNGGVWWAHTAVAQKGRCK